VTTDVAEEIGAALRLAAEEIEPPALDLATIKRIGRRRRIRARVAATIAAVASVGVAGGLGVALPLQFGPGPKAPRLDALTGATAHIRAFYLNYAAARSRGPGAVNALIASYAAGWYTPILQTAAATASNPVNCAETPLPGTSMKYQQVGEFGGQEVVVTRWGSAARVAAYNVVTTTPRTWEITGITCVVAGYALPLIRAKDAATQLFASYSAARIRGVPTWTELRKLTLSGPELGSVYFSQLAKSVTSRQLSYDPVLCTSRAPGPHWSFTVSQVKVVAGQSTALVVVKPGAAAPILTVIGLGAKGYDVMNIACNRP
jgi:hypothetical protein